MNNKLTCFKAYDIRGKIDSEISDEIFYRIARAYGEFLKPRQVVVGADVRLTSEQFKSAVIEGLRDAGVDVLDLGLAGTEEIYFAAFHLKLDGGVEITASHNPMDFNGMKLVGHCAAPISSETGLREIQAIAEANQFATVTAEQRGSYHQLSLLGEYTNHLMQYIDLKQWNRPLKVVINSGNGAAGHVIDAIEQRFIEAKVPITLIKVHHQADGHFPNGIPNPLLPENRQDTINAVLNHQADLGIAFDGDFDRCFFFDETGQFIEGYYIVGLLAEVFLKQKPGSKIIYDPRLIWNTIDIVQQFGGEAIMSRTGHSFIKQLMRDNDVIYGGEMSAHHYFRDFGYCDSGMIPWLLVLQLLSGKSETLGELVASRIVAYPSSGEINRQVDDPQKVIQSLYEKWQDNAKTIDETDGISMAFEGWRFNVRASNTEPLLRLNVESKQDVELMQRMTKKILEDIDLSLLERITNH